MTASRRSFAPSLDRIVRIWPFTVSFEIVSSSATILFERPRDTERSTSNSRADNSSDEKCRVSSEAISFGMWCSPLWTVRIA